MKKASIYITCCFILFASASPAHARLLAERLESDSFVIQFGNFNTTSGQKSSTSYSVTDTVGQFGSGPYGQYGSSNFFVGSGFQYIYQIDTFSFRLSKSSINFGELIPNFHETDSLDMAITTRGAGGYSVYAYQAHALRHSNGTDEIPNTTCDAADCTHITAGVWIDKSIGGFGYTMSGDDVPVEFTDITYFKSFADQELLQPMQIVMSSSNIANQRLATATYQAGILGDQASGSYETAITYIAVPGY